MQKAKKGIWTPWAQVLCYECHGPTFPKTVLDGEGGFKSISVDIPFEEWRQNTSLLEVEEGQAITHCDKCSQAIRVYESVATEHNMVKDLKAYKIDASMAQTGGMCSACEVTRQFEGELPENEYPPHYLMTYGWDGDGSYCLGAYDQNGDWDEEFGFETKSYNEMVNYILELKDVKKLDSK